MGEYIRNRSQDLRRAWAQNIDWDLSAGVVQRFGFVFF